MSRRSQWFEELARRIAAKEWRACPELLYRVLYGLPSDQQLAMAIAEMKRYLPLFRVRWPGFSWPEQILNSPEAWIEKFRREVPQEPSAANAADASFFFCFDALLLGTTYRANPRVLTSSAACAVLDAIQAFESDPLAPAPRDTSRVREWQCMLDWLRTRKLSLAPDAETEALERDLAVWKEHSMQLIVPESEVRPQI